MDMASGAIKEEIPSISSIFAILEPMILPSARPLLPLKLALRLTANSGAEVPKLTTVSPMIMSESPVRFAKAAEAPTNISAPLINNTNPIAN